MGWLIASIDAQVAIVTLKIIIASLLGGIVGLERSKGGRQAGTKTHALVCLGGTVAMALDLHYGDGLRLSAAVLSGIGFLGAGVILIDQKTKVVGLTTAAGIWLTACLGILIGSDLSVASIPLVICFFLITHFFPKIEELLKKQQVTNIN